MQSTVHPSKISGSISAPPSKSVMQRACLAALLRGGKTIISHPGVSDDDAVMLRFITEAGGMTGYDGQGRLDIDATDALLQSVSSFHFGASGLAARMCIPLLALYAHEVGVAGNAQLSARPMQPFETILPQLGVKILTEAGHLPMSIRGPLQPKSIVVDGSISSQFITGLIMAYSAAGASGVSLTVKDSVSVPYLDLTLDVMRDFGLDTPKNTKPGIYDFEAATGRKNAAPFTYNIPGDWSSAAFLLVAGAVAGDVSVTGLDAFSAQGDKAVLQALMDAGPALSVMADRVRVQKAALKAFHFNATDTPDLFPPLAALALYANGTSVIEGVGRLWGKESDRATTICEELAKMGATIYLQDDLMIIEGSKPLAGAAFSAHGDHRIAMMCAAAALGASSPSTINEAEVVAKSYPDFWQDMQSLGASIQSE